MDWQARYLTERDRRVLDFIARYRIGTVHLLRSQCFSGETTVENVHRVLRRLEARGLMHRVTSRRGLSYCTLSRPAFPILGLPARTPRPLTEQTLPVALAVATYCVERGLRRMTTQEFRDLYPELWRPGLRSSNYVLVDIEGRLRLEMLLVDQGGAAHRIHARVRRLIDQRKGLPKFHTLMRAGRFRVMVLTGTPEQAGKIERRIRSRPFGLIDVQACVLPVLAPWLVRGGRSPGAGPRSLPPPHDEA